MTRAWRGARAAYRATGPRPRAICEVMDPDGHMLAGSAVERFALKMGIPMIAVDELAAHCQKRLRETAVMARDDRSTVKLSALFDPEPHTWGLRGDPYLWRELRERLSSTDFPASADEVTALLH